MRNFYPENLPKRKAPFDYNRKGDGGGHADWLPKNKIQLFFDIFNKVAQLKGSSNKARIYLKLTTRELYNMKSHTRLSARIARRILDGYNALKKGVGV